MKKPVSKSPAGTSSRKPASKATSGATRSAPTPQPSKNILTAGIKALTHAHEEAVARQSRVFESLLGLGSKHTAEGVEGTPATPATPLDPFGFRKFEDVFDQRVARAMENLKVPTAEAFAALIAEVERLRDTVARLETQARKR